MTASVLVPRIVARPGSKDEGSTPSTYAAYALTPRASVDDDDWDSDEELAIEVEFAALSSGAKVADQRGRGGEEEDAVQRVRTSVFKVSTPRKSLRDEEEEQENNEEEEEDREQQEQEEKVFFGSLPENIGDSPHTASKPYFSIQDEFAALGAAEASGELSSDQRETGNTLRICLLRERLKIIGRERRRSDGWAWAPALAQQPQASEEPEAAPQDMELWPSAASSSATRKALQEQLSKLQQERPQAEPPASDYFFNFAEINLTEEEASLEEQLSRLPPQEEHEQIKQAAPPASDPFFHFLEIDLAEEDQREARAFLRSTWRAWRLLTWPEVTCI